MVAVLTALCLHDPAVALSVALARLEMTTPVEVVARFQYSPSEPDKSWRPFQVDVKLEFMNSKAFSITTLRDTSLSFGRADDGRGITRTVKGDGVTTIYDYYGRIVPPGTLSTLTAFRLRHLLGLMGAYGKGKLRSIHDRLSFGTTSRWEGQEVIEIKTGEFRVGITSYYLERHHRTYVGCEGLQVARNRSYQQELAIPMGVQEWVESVRILSVQHLNHS